MKNHELAARLETIKVRALGQWSHILGRLLPDPRIINRKNQPCPRCRDGTDRFQYTDKYGHGDAHCRYCGHLDGFGLLQCVNGWSFLEACKEVEKLVGAGVALPSNSRNTGPMRALVKRLWEEVGPIMPGDEVDQYLRGRDLGMDAYPETLRSHPKLGYFVKREGDRKPKLVRHIPAMLAPLRDAQGNVVTLHRTYVENGEKAKVSDPKKCLNTFDPGPAIRLFEPTDELALTEGIETALAIHLRLGKPVWATYSASNMEQAWVPPTVKRVHIYADHDASFTGHAAAYALAKRLKAESRKIGQRDVQVFIPSQPESDWADVWMSRQAKVKRVA